MVSEKQSENYEKALRAEDSENEKRKMEAVDACIDEHIVLMECFKNTSFFSKGCYEESSKFWKCYEKHRGFQKNKVQVFFDKLLGAKD